MVISVDPENNETRAIFDIANFGGQHVLEIGCGNGRFTWRYADKTKRVTAIEPAARQIALVREHLPRHLQGHIEFYNSAFEDFAVANATSAFDIVILSWSLC